jgi:hypothetical protein
MSDLSSYVVHRTAAFLEACKEAESKLDGYLVSTNDRPDIARELLRMLVAADDLLQLAEPGQTSGEFHGLSKDDVSGARRAAAFTNDEGWDFRPWFGEKAANVKRGIKSAIDYWEKDPDAVERRPGTPISPRSWLRDGILSGLAVARRDAQKIFDMTFREEISIQNAGGV